MTDKPTVNHLRMEVFNGRVSITWVPLAQKWTKTRNISPETALDIAALMMRSGHLPSTMTVTGDPEVVCQVVGEDEAAGPRRAWLGVQAWGYQGDHDLVAYLEGEQVIEIGRCLHQLCMEVIHPDAADGQRSIFTREVTGFFLSGGEEEDIWNLETVDPEHL